MSTHHPNYLIYSRYRVGSSVRRTLHGNYKKDKETGQPYADHQAPNLDKEANSSTPSIETNSTVVSENIQTEWLILVFLLRMPIS